jgi:hypothetical protein
MSQDARPLATRARGERAPAQGPESKGARCLPGHSAGSGWGAAQRREAKRLRGSPTHCGSFTPRGAAQRREAKRLRGSPTHCGSSTPRGAAQRREAIALQQSSMAGQEVIEEKASTWLRLLVAKWRLGLV